MTPIDRSVPTAPAPTDTVRPDQAAENREVVKAVKALNQSEMFGQDNLLTFQRDPETQKMVIRIINKKTQEVVTQIPPEYVLQLSEDLKVHPTE